jgi:hypothetical protein
MIRRPHARKTIPGSVITGPALWAAAKARVFAWDRLAKSPEAIRRVQLDTLLRICDTAASTEFGVAHGLGAVTDAADFARRVPLRSYADFEPQLERMRRGERNVLWPHAIEYFGLSSGSSHTKALNKYLPISEEQIGWQQKAGFDVVARYLHLTGDKGFTGGFTLGLLPPCVPKQEGAVQVISNPGLMQLRLPGPSKMMMIPKPPIRDMEIYEEKLTAIAQSYLDHDVIACSGTTCWFSILFDKVLEHTRKKTVREIWPNLRVLFGGGVHAEPYRKIIEERVGGPIALMDNYNATEGGFFSVTDDLSDDGMLVIPDRGVFFEFVERADHGKPDAKRVPLWEVVPERDYSVVLTTTSGLFGYYIGDFVRFSSIFPHRLRFAGRASGVLSVTQELTSQIEIEQAVAGAIEAVPSTIFEYAAGADLSGAKGNYVLYAEFDRDPADLDAFSRAFDQALCKLNRVYREHRANDVAILAPRLVPLERGSVRKFMERLGQTSPQHKFPRIVDENRRRLLDTFRRGAERQENRT